MKNDNKSDMPDRQLPTADTPHNESEWTEIGKAEITQSIFGKAKVRIIRQHDKARRAWFLTALAVLALMVTTVAALVWQEQNAPQASKTVRSTEPAPQLSALPEANAPAPQAIPATGIPLIMEKSKPGTPAAIDNPADSRVPQQSLTVNAAEQPAAKPVAPQHVIASKPKTMPLATNNNAAKNQTSMQQPPKLPSPIQPVAPTVATPPATQPTGDNQPADPINAQHN